MSTQNIYDLTDTWNAGGTTFTAIKMNVTDTASAAGSLLMDLQVGGTSQFSVRKDGLTTAPRFSLAGNVSAAAWTTNGIGLTNVARTLTDTSSSGTVATAYTNVLGGNTIAASSATTFTNYGTLQLGSPTAGTNVTITNSFSLVTAGNIGVGSTDVVLARDAANTLAQRNGTNAQAFRIYNTFTDASNYERLSLGVVTANRFSVQSLAAGTGTQRPLDLNGAQIQFQTAGAARWEFNGSGHLLANIDNAYDIGGNNVNRPRVIYVASGLVLGNSGNIQWSGRSVILSPSNGVLVLQNNGLTDFGRLQFGGTTSSFPSLKRNSTALETKLADDSAYAPHAMQYLDIDDGMTAPGAATGRARIYVDTADGDLKVIFADGTIKTIVTDT